MGEKFGNYEIIRKIAVGGMAEVFLAKQVSLGGFERLVCIKRILPHLGEQDDFIRMFMDEARIAANLIHPNIAQIYDIGCIDGAYYIAMEYVRGEDLRKVYNQEVSRGRAMPLAPAAHIAMGVAAGLDYAHRQTSLDGKPLGIVHRDVSPQNILVTYDGHVKIVDFGVAKAAGKMNETRSGVLKGKYSYMSPEQAAGDPIDGRTDVFALGITLYEVTTGVRLFKRENEIETLHAVIECAVTAPNELIPGYAATLQEIGLKALSHDPNARFESAAEFERALERFLVEQNHATSASSLATYMQELFAEKLADEVLFGGQPWGEDPTPPRQAQIAGERRLRDVEEVSQSRRIEEAPFESVSDISIEIEEGEIERDEDATVVDQDLASHVPNPARQQPLGTSGWEAESSPELQTATQYDPRVTPPRPVVPHELPSAAAEPTPAIRRSVRPVRRNPWIPYAVASMLVALFGAGVFVAKSLPKPWDSVPRTAQVLIDSEPRGARVDFQGMGTDHLNNELRGYQTPFTLPNGIPVIGIERVRFFKDGYVEQIVELPDLREGKEPPPVFAELKPVQDNRRPAELVLLTEPEGAEVWIDGTVIPGRTPLNNVRVRGGESHRIEFRLRQHKTRWETLYVEPGARRFIEVSLHPLSQRPKKRVASATPEATEAPAKKEKPEAAATTYGYLNVNAPLTFKVDLDGFSIGETPVRRHRVRANKSIKVMLENNQKGLVIRRRIKVGTNRTASIDINLQKGALSLNATPWAWVRVGNNAPQETPISMNMYEGEYRVLFECPDGKRESRRAQVSPGKTQSLSISCN